MKKNLLAIAVTTCLGAWPSVSVIAKTEVKKPSQEELNRQLFYRQALADLGPKEILPVDQALAKLIPDPYIIYVDKAIPATLQLSFVNPGKDTDWFDALEKSLKQAGLAVQADWNRNTLRVVAAQSRDKTHAPQNQLAQPASPVVAPVFRGRFESAGDGDAQPVRKAGTAEEISAKTPARDEVPMPELRVIRSSHLAGRLPNRSDMWELMQAVVAGRRIMLVGYSAVAEEKTRVRLSNTYAHRLRARLLEIGYPEHLVVVHERKEYKEKSERPQVQVVVEQLSGAIPTASSNFQKRAGSGTGTARSSRHLKIILNPEV
jgi:hypothetical protein